MHNGRGALMANKAMDSLSWTEALNFSKSKSEVAHIQHLLGPTPATAREEDICVAIRRALKEPRAPPHMEPLAFSLSGERAKYNTFAKQLEYIDNVSSDFAIDDDIEDKFARVAAATGSHSSSHSPLSVRRNAMADPRKSCCDRCGGGGHVVET